MFGATLLTGGRLRHALRRLRARAAAPWVRCLPLPRYAAGSETRLMLGTSQPWIIALGQTIPIAAMAWFVADSRVWVVLLMIFSAIAGAITSQGAARSRRLWLRFDWRREQFFARVERAYWRYNAHSLAVLVALFLALGVYGALPISTMLPGVVLLGLGCAVFQYLGLMVTRGLGWFESALCIVTMVALTLAAFALARENTTMGIEIAVLLAGLAAAYRRMARARWAALDWMRCRSDARRAAAS